jgi:hypothetical protein
MVITRNTKIITTKRNTREHQLGKTQEHNTKKEHFAPTNFDEWDDLTPITLISKP